MGGEVEWPDLPGGYEVVDVSPLYVSLDCIHFYEVPEGMSVTEFLERLKRDGQAQDG